MIAPRQPRIRQANDRSPNTSGQFVLYWMQMFRRLHANHALDHALQLCREWGKPLVVYEGLKLNYPWASDRHHTFILQGMRDNAEAAKRLGVSYWPFVETPSDPGHGLLKKLAARACAIVTDDYPAFITPAHNRAIANRCDIPVILVDSNSIVPLSLLGEPVPSAAVLRRRIHKLFVEAWNNRARNEPDVPKSASNQIDPPFNPWNPQQDIASFIAKLPIDHSVPAVSSVAGGSGAGQALLNQFIAHKLPRYSQERNYPTDPARSAASGLSAHLHHGHLAIQEVVKAALGPDWTPAEINWRVQGQRNNFLCSNPNVNEFLDEAITWRDVGYQWHWSRYASRTAMLSSATNQSWSTNTWPQFNFETFDFSPGGERTLDAVLPAWAQTTLRNHEADRREYLYELDQFEAADTHDPLWNAAQRELVFTGRIHNYLRMLWGKKVIEWTKTPAEADAVLEHLNNKYALDGRDPNSYTGILWCFGLFDRPWYPERAIFGTIRYMSSENTARKFKLSGYLEYVARVVAEAQNLTTNPQGS